ncbi:MAG: hypothetical protein M3112_01440 [Actinomycetia bacterium]|nr:hypothetical protein [Actinomycetes bacterium]
MKKIIASVAAAGVLVVGAFAASTITTSEASAQTEETPAVTDEIRRPRTGAILDEVLADLVADGTLEQDEADAVTSAMADKWDELKEKFSDRKERRAHLTELHDNIQSWLEDGVITADELAELDVDLPRFEDGPLAEALEDGQITQAEWDAFMEEREARHETRRNVPEGAVAS